jgi:hypothetical protein
MADRVIVSDLVAQIAYVGGEDDIDAVLVSGLALQAAYTGGGGEPNRIDVSEVAAQIAHVGGLNDIDGLKISDLIAQIAYLETYPNIPLSGYAPRILVDIWRDAGVVRFSTVDTIMEEL